MRHRDRGGDRARLSGQCKSVLEVGLPRTHFGHAVVHEIHAPLHEEHHSGAQETLRGLEGTSHPLTGPPPGETESHGTHPTANVHRTIGGR